MSSQKQRRPRSEEHTSELQSPCNLVCRLLLEKKKLNSGREERCNSRLNYAACWRRVLSTASALKERDMMPAANSGFFFFLRSAPPAGFTPFPPPAPSRT